MFQKTNKVGIQQTSSQNEQSQNHSIFGKIKKLTQPRISITPITPLDKKPKRKNMPISLFCMVSLMLLLFAYQGIFTFFSALSYAQVYYLIFYMVTTCLIMLGTSIYLVNFSEMLNLYILLDPVTLSFGVALIAFFGSIKTSQDAFPFFAKTFQYSEPITQFIMTGTFRVIMKHANFNRLQNIIFKIIIFLNGLCFFALGFYIMFSNYKASKGISSATDNQYQDFSVLYVFGNLGYYKQLCSLHNRFDKTTKLKYDYKLSDQVQDSAEVDQQQQLFNNQIKV